MTSALPVDEGTDGSGPIFLMDAVLNRLDEYSLVARRRASESRRVAGKNDKRSSDGSRNEVLETLLESLQESGEA